MVAIQSFVDAAESRSGDLRLRRARLGALSSTLGTFADMPEPLRRVVDGIVQEIEDRAFRPIQRASDLDGAMTQAKASFVIFADLWPAALGAIIPWMLDNPERLVAIDRVLTDTWTSEEARRVLGDDAVSWFAAAQDARVAIAHALPRDVAAVSPDAETILGRCVVADFAILLGLFLAQHPTPRVPEGLPVTIAKLAYEAAKEAYVLATTERFADPEPVAVGS
jgi:hypothetical protein